MPASSLCSECGASVRLSAEGPDLHINVPVAPGTLARHQELMTTNEPPQGAELLLIRAIVTKTGARLADVEDEISRLRDRLQQLEEEHTSLSRYHAPNIAILSPLRRIPTEVLAEIFSWTLPSASEISLRKRLSDNPWVLTRVCRRWRAVALAASSLWSRVVIDYSQAHANPLALVKIQIERSRNQNLKIHFIGNEKLHSRPQIRVFRFLTEYSARWEEFSVELTTNISPLLAKLRGRVPSLRVLRIKWESSESQAGLDSIDCFQTASCLVDVDILNEYRHISIPLSAHQLTHYNVDAPWEVHHEILKLAKGLVQARLSVDFDDHDPWPDAVNIINMKSLQRLCVSNAQILAYLRAPSLQELVVDADAEEEPVHHLEPFIARSACNLPRLCLVGAPSTRATAEILRKVSCIVELGILIYKPDAAEEVNTLMLYLTILDPIGTPPVVPHLRNLFFGFTGECYIDYGLYLRMLQSRRKSRDCALKAAALLTQLNGPDATIINGLSMLRRDGLDLLLLRGKDASLGLRAWIYDYSWD